MSRVSRVPGAVRAVVVVAMLLAIVRTPVPAIAAPVVTCTVTDSVTQLPVGGAHVTLWSYDQAAGWLKVAETTTGKAGGCSFDYRLDVGKRYGVDVSAAGYQDSTCDDSSMVTYQGSPFVLAVVLVPGTDVVSGTITDGAASGPIEGAQVWLYRYDGMGWVRRGEAQTDALGRYECRTTLEVGVQYCIDVNAAGYASYFSNADDLVRYTGTPLIFNIALMPLGGTGAVTGMVRDAGTEAIVAGADVALEFFDEDAAKWIEFERRATGATGAVGFVEGLYDFVEYRLAVHGGSAGYADGFSVPFMYDGSARMEEVRLSRLPNSPPVLAPIGNKTAIARTQLSFTARASDSDGDSLAFSLGRGTPPGAEITAAGLFTWTPTELQSPGVYLVTIVVRDEHGATDSEVITITVSTDEPPPATLVVTPIEGANRYATAIAASRKAFTGSGYVVIATGANWPDALGGSALAGALDAPILLTRPDTLPAEVKAEIVRLGATKVIVLGSSGAVSNAVFSQIDAIAGVSVERIAGANRYDTANLVAARTIKVLGAGYDGTAFVATGANFPDALGASPLAAAKGWPIYLANPNQGSNAGLIVTMRAAGVTDAILLGGTNVVYPQVQSALGATFETRLAGANRYDTAVKVAAYGVANADLGWDKVAIATGTNFPDALAGGVLQGKHGSVLVLTPTSTLNDGVAAALRANKASINEVRFLGSTGAVSQTVRNQVTSILQK